MSIRLLESLHEGGNRVEERKGWREGIAGGKEWRRQGMMGREGEEEKNGGRDGREDEREGWKRG